MSKEKDKFPTPPATSDFGSRQIFCLRGADSIGHLPRKSRFPLPEVPARSPVKTSSNDSLLDAENLLKMIDEIGVTFRNKSNANTPRELLATTMTAASNTTSPIFSSMVEVCHPMSISNTKVTGKRHGHKKYDLAIPDTSDLDALEAWVFSAEDDISVVDLQVAGKTLDNASYDHQEKTPQEFEIRTADKAVEEIDAILDSLSIATEREYNIKESMTGRQTQNIRVTSSSGISENSSSKELKGEDWHPFIFPNSYHLPIRSTRISPLKNMVADTKDTFDRRQTTNISTPYRPHFLPKLENAPKLSHQLLNEGKERNIKSKPSDEKAYLKRPEEYRVNKTIKPYTDFSFSPQKKDEHIFLPGQVEEKNDNERNVNVNTRNIMLDYSCNTPDKEKSKRWKICKTIFCCKAEESDVEKYAVNENGNLNEFIKIEDANVGIRKDMSESFPRRVWRRIKKRLGF